MTDKITDASSLVKIAAFKANQELGDVNAPKGETEEKFLSTDAAKPILDKYEESEINRDNSFKDPMTGLLNRRGLVEEYKVSMGMWEREGLVESNALIALDLIGLKKLNDTLSPAVADQIIQNAAEHLRGRVRETDLVGRWGGDEMLLVLFGVKKVDVEELASEVNRNLPEHVRFNIGYKITKPNADFEESMKNVMDQMEQVKKIGGVDNTGRAVGRGVVVDIDTLNHNV